MLFRQLFDLESSTYTYLLADEATREAVLIDPVKEQLERDITLLRELGLTLRYALDTHVHADHVTALGALREATGCRTALSQRAGVGCADLEMKTGARIEFGQHALEVRETPGHTSGCLTYVLDDRTMAFTGDALLVRGTGRTDFQEGDARTLYRSVHSQIFALPDDCLVYPAHDYKGRTVTSVGEEKTWNPRLGGGKTVEEFVEIMSKLDLAYPKKIDVALPANLQCGLPRGTDRHDTEEKKTMSGDSSWAPIETSAVGVPEVSADWVADHARDARRIDVREPHELTSELGHASGVALVPLSTVEKVATSWDKDAALVIICRSGGRSGKAALALRALGFTKVASMRGGMLEWNEKKLPIERTAVTVTG